MLGSDPTTARLEAHVAALLGKEAGLFVPSGTMGNLLAVLVHCDGRGSEFILGSHSHIHIYEQGGTASLGGVHPFAVANQADGTMALADIEAAVRPVDDDHYPTTRLVVLETTHNKMGGRVLSTDYINQVGSLARRHGLALHIDGARLLNAAAAAGVAPAEMVAAADSVSLCLSKGVGAPG